LNDASLDRLVSVAANVLARLQDRGMTLATAESISGGLIGHILTETPGSSRVYLGGVVAYDNRLKQLIGVPAQTLEEHGAVSEQTAVAMAKGIRNWTGADMGVATTGIAGPGGATETKPVGLTYIGLADQHGAAYQMLQLMGDRSSNKVETAEAALEFVLRVLRGRRA
jgi:nicotinamide-nucleotide amidase